MPFSISESRLKELPSHGRPGLFGLGWLRGLYARNWWYSETKLALELRDYSQSLGIEWRWMNGQRVVVACRGLGFGRPCVRGL